MKNCIFWNHLKDWDVYLEKDPEWVILCLGCAEKHPDEMWYKTRLIKRFNVPSYPTDDDDDE